MDGVLAIFAKAAADNGPIGLLVGFLVALLCYLIHKCHADATQRDKLHREDLKEATAMVGENTTALTQIRETLIVIKERIRG